MIISLVFGPICSGKTTYCNTLINSWPSYEETKCEYISVSQIVRDLSKTEVRSELQKTTSLAPDIFAALVEKIDAFSDNTSLVLVDGIRQLSIVNKLISYYGIENIRFVWLEPSKLIRKQRYDAAKRKKDDIDFETADKNDFEMGLRDIYLMIQNLISQIR